MPSVVQLENYREREMPEKKNGTTQRCGSNLSNYVFVVDTAVMQGVKKFFNMQQVILCHQTQTKDRIKSRTIVKSHFFR